MKTECHTIPWNIQKQRSGGETPEGGICPGSVQTLVCALREGHTVDTSAPLAQSALRKGGGLSIYQFGDPPSGGAVPCSGCFRPSVRALDMGSGGGAFPGGPAGFFGSAEAFPPRSSRE